MEKKAINMKIITIKNVLSMFLAFPVMNPTRKRDATRMLIPMRRKGFLRSLEWRKKAKKNLVIKGNPTKMDVRNPSKISSPPAFKIKEGITVLISVNAIVIARKKACHRKYL